jgi:hypothetical protein
MPKYTLERDGKTAHVESPRDLSPEELQGVANQHFGAVAPRGEGDKATGPTTPESIQRGIFGAGQPEPLDIAQRIGNAVLPPLVGVPAETALTGGVGSIASKLVPQAPRLVGAGARALTAGAIGGVESGSVGRGAADAGIAAVFEGILSGVTHAKIPKMTSSLSDLAGRVAGRRAQFERATDAVDAAFDAIASRLPSGKFLYVPALSAKKMSADEARAALKKAEGATYDAARKQLFAELKELDKRAATAPSIGQNLYTAPEFASQTLKKRFQPPASGGERMAEKALEALGSPGTRAAVDVAATEDVGGVPAGLWPPLMASPESLRGLAEKVIRR